MFRIGEFAKFARVSVRMLRYYDAAGLLKPAAADVFTGYRLYTVEQIPELQKILLLRDLGFQVAEIAAALERWSADFAIKLLAAKKQDIAEAVKLEQKRIEWIDIAIRDIESGAIAIHQNVSLRSVPSHLILSLREMIQDYFCEGALWKKLYDFIEENRVSVSAGTNNLAIFHDEERPGVGVDVETGVIVKQTGQSKGGFIYRTTEAVETMACVMVYGPYDRIGPAYHTFARWLEGHRQYEADGPVRQICHVGAWNERDPDKFLTEVQTPVRLKLQSNSKRG